MSNVPLIIRDILDDRKSLSERVSSIKSLMTFDTSELIEFSSLLAHAANNLLKKTMENPDNVVVFIEFLNAIKKIFNLLSDKSAKQWANILMKSLNFLIQDMESTLKVLSILNDFLRNRPSQIFTIKYSLKELLESDTYDPKLKKEIIKLIRSACWSFPSAISDFKETLNKLIKDPYFSDDIINLYLTIASRNFRVIAPEVLGLLREIKDLAKILEILASYVTLRADIETLSELYNKIKQIASRVDLDPRVRSTAVKALAVICREKDKRILQDDFSVFIRTNIKLEGDMQVKLAMIEATEIVRWYSETTAGDIISELIGIFSDETENVLVRKSSLNALIHLIVSYPNYADDFLTQCLKVIKESLSEELRANTIRSLAIVCPLVPEKFSKVASELLALATSDEVPLNLRIESMTVLNKLSDRYSQFSEALAEFSENISKGFFGTRSSHIKNEIIRLIRNIHRHLRKLPRELIEVTVNAFISQDTYISAHDLLFSLSSEIPNDVAQYADRILEFPLLISSVLEKLSIEGEYMFMHLQESLEEPIRNYFRILEHIYEYLDETTKAEVIENIITVLSMKLPEAIIPTIVNEAKYVLRSLKEKDPSIIDLIKNTIKKVSLPDNIRESLEKAHLI